jgi:hypothetical protein
MAEIGIAPHVADKILNHTSGEISGVAAIYNRFEYLDERKTALNALGRKIGMLIGPVATTSSRCELKDWLEACANGFSTASLCLSALARL